jgi:hypothetical protein
MSLLQKKSNVDECYAHMKSLGWKRPNRAGASMTDFKNPNGEDEIWLDEDGRWRHMFRDEKNQWHLLAEGESLGTLRAELGKAKQSRDLMKDDAGASTGLRRQPDYGEPDSYTEKMNEQNKKGTVAGYIIAVKTAVKTAASNEMYISAVEFDPKDAAHVEKFSFTADSAQAMTFHLLTAQEVARQVSSPAFGARARVIAAVNYEGMFKAVEKLVPQSEVPIRREVQWAKQILKKNDRVVWYLRMYRFALVKNLLDEQQLYDGLQPHYGEPKTADTVPLQPQGQPPPPQPELEQQKPMMTTAQRLEDLLTQYKKEFSAKGGNPAVEITLEGFAQIKRQMEHFLSLPVPDIQDKVLTVESYSDVYNAYSVAEQAWKEQATKLLKPKAEDKVWMQFPDGWAWWHLPRCACDEESKAMGHCGNSPRRGQSDCSILSLREPKKYGKDTRWYPHLTFILNGPNSVAGGNGSLGEMKGRNNDKPIAKYHPYITAMLKDQRITSAVGGGYLPEHNFALADLTLEQQKEVATANPSIGMTIRDYFNEHGMDGKLVTRIRAVLGLEAVSGYSEADVFIIRAWKDKEEFIQDCGDRDAKKAWRFIETGESDTAEPDADDLVDLMDDLEEPAVYHVGLALQYHYAAEIQQWYDTAFDPHDPQVVKSLLKDIFELKVQPALKAQEDATKSIPIADEDREEYEEKEKRENKKKKTNAYSMPVIKDFYYSYRAGDPDVDTVEALLENATEHTIGEMKNSTIEYTPTGILQTIETEEAIELATQTEGNVGRTPEFPSPSIYMDGSWDDWDGENAKQALSSVFQERPKRPAAEKQKNLPYKGKGIKVTKLLKNPLFTLAKSPGSPV